MSKILIVDDNSDHSETIKHNLELYLEGINSDLQVTTTLPFKNTDLYFSFLTENEVSVLIIDEKLNENAVDADGPVEYKGSDLISILRERLKELPIFCISNYPDVEELKLKYSEYEEIFNRKDFVLHTDKYAPKIWRSANNYFNENIEELASFNELTELISNGNDNPENIERLRALQAKLQIPFDGFDDRNTWLNKYETQINQLEELKNRIATKLGK